jgi:DNA invertase Pin-like site-specific DNA recombinase
LTVAKLDDARRAAIYVRISSADRDDDADFGRHDELGVKRQEKLCRELADRLGWPIVGDGVYRDNNVSAFKRGKRRPQFDRLLDDITAGRIDSLLVYNPDRLCRDDLRGLETLIDLLNTYNVDVATVRSGDFDLSSAHGRAQARMAGVWARLESEKMSERLTDKHAEIAEAGDPNGGRRPFGYHNDRATPATPDSFPCSHPNSDKCNAGPHESSIVVEIIERVAAGETLTRIADDLNVRNVRSSTGARWNISMVRRVALNGRYAGRRFHKGVEIGAASWPAIVDETTWRRAVAMLNAPDRPKRRSSRRYLLAGGLIVCGKCGTAMRSKQHHARDGMVPVYACPPKRYGGCGGTTVRAEAVEELVRARVVEVVESAEYAETLHTRQHGADRSASNEAARIEAQIAELEAGVDGSEHGLTPVDFLRMRKPLMERLADARARMADDTQASAVGRFAGQTGMLADWWDNTSSLDQRQAVVRAVIEPVTIKPVGKHNGKQFDPSRVVIRRRR